MTEQKCTCQKVPELNYVNSDPDCPVCYPKVDQEKKWEEEFEEWFRSQNPEPERTYNEPCFFHYIGKEIFKISKNQLWTVRYFSAKLGWLESRRRFISQLKKDSKLAGFNIEEWKEERDRFFLQNGDLIRRITTFNENLERAESRLKKLQEAVDKHKNTSYTMGYLVIASKIVDRDEELYKVRNEVEE